MEEFNKTKQRFWCGYMSCLIVGIVIMAVLAVLGLINITRVSAAADWLCEYVAALTVYPDVRAAEWVGYPEGWRDMPDDLGNDMMLPVSEDGEQFYLLKSSAKAGETWLWTYRSMATWTDSEGEHDGHHDFCDAVLVIDQ